MCGIAAIVDSEGRDLASRLTAATTQLRHRGPDGWDVWVQDQGIAGLGHTRLSIIDVERGRQPLYNEDASIFATINGEFYGSEALRERLEQKGHRFRTHSDCEILPHLYEESGIDCLRELRGEFAFALWDEKRSRLWAARDRFGVKPLFYHNYRDSLTVASEAKSLFAFDAPRAWDQESLLQQLFFFPQQDRTLFKDIRQVPPGHFLLYERNQLRISRYWDLDCPTLGAANGTDEQHAAWSQAVRQAVRTRLRSEVPVTVFLSGGLDSSCVLSLSAEVLRPLEAIHVSFPGTDLDEADMACRAAEHAGVGLRVLEITEQDLVDSLPEAIWHGEMLAFNAHGVARFLQSRAARAAGYKVALTGEGADETLAGYPGFRADAAEAPPRPSGGEGSVVMRNRLGFSPGWMERVHRERTPFYALLDSSVLSTFGFDALCESFLDQFDVVSQLKERHPLHQSMYLWMKSVLPNYTLCADRLDMAHGVETRPPFLDHLLWEVTRSLPADQLIRGEEEKWILRQAAKTWVPEEIRRRTKHSFTAPAFSDSKCLRTFINDELRSAGFRSVPLIDHDAVTGLLDTLTGADIPATDTTVMMLLCMHLLNKAYSLS
jgi:asparagine synthase (glutamine-hydrolysing)